MIKYFSTFVFFLAPFFLLGQAKPLIEYDIETGEMTELPLVLFNGEIPSENTSFFIGNYSQEIEILDDNPPTENLFGDAQFSYKIPASDLFDVSAFPVRANVKLFAMQGDSLAPFCTGIMVSKKHVLTAAHCFIESGTDSLLQNIILSCAAYDDGVSSNLFPCAYANKAYSFKQWNIAGNDLMLLELEEEIGVQTGWVGMAFVQDNSVLNGCVMHKFSYPGVFIPGVDSVAYNGDTLYHSYGVVDIVNDLYIGVEGVSGIPGESGSSFLKVRHEEEYLTYGVSSYSNNILNSRINNWEFYAFKDIVKDDLSVNVDTEDKTTFQVYPNPFSQNLLVITGLSNRPIPLQIINGQGQLLEDHLLSSHSHQHLIQCQHFPKGIYYLRIQLGERWINKKVAKL